MKTLTPYQYASSYLGTREIPGPEHSHFVQAWLEEAGLGHNTADETAWCGAFVNHVAIRFGLERPQLPARARSWLRVGVPVALEYAENPADVASIGDVVILQRGAGPQPGADVVNAPGHVAFFAGLDGDSVLLLGGNQGNSVSIQHYPRSRVLGVRVLREFIA